MHKFAYGLIFSLLLTGLSISAKAEVSPETVVDIFERIESLEKKTRELHGKNEELQYQIKELKKQQKKGFLGVDERIDELAKSIKSNSKPVEESVQTKGDDENKESPRVKIIDETSSSPAEEADPASKKDTATTDTVDKITGEKKDTDNQKPAKKRRAPSQYEKETYQAAFKLMKTSPSAASKAFQEYIKMQPDSPLAANAQYWIGEIKYSHNNYKGAVQEFIKVLQKYKYSDKAPDAAIKLGYSFYALKNWAYARRTFEDVLRYFPENQNAVNLARKRLETMKAAGH